VTAQAEAERLLASGEVAALFRVDTETVTKWARNKTLPSILTPGGRRRYRESVVRALLPADGKLLTPVETAALCKATVKTVTRWAEAGKLTSYPTPGGHRRFRESEVHELARRLGAGKGVA
jgi:excisionase family DNA binding protein